MIIDCHAHIARTLSGFWQPLPYGKVQDRGQVRQLLPPAFHPASSPPEVLLGYMDDAGVDRAFLVQHDMYGDQDEVVLDAVRRWPDRFTGWAYFADPERRDARDRLAQGIDRGLIGVKVEVASARRLRPQFRFDGEPERRLWRELDNLRRPLALDLNAATVEDIAALRTLIAEFRNIQVLVCHVGGPPRAGWQERALVAKQSHGWVDVSALPVMWGPEQEYPYPQGQEVVHWAVDTFGADRVMWGSDYPPSLMYGTYRQLLDFVRRHCAFLTSEQKALITGGTADSFLRSIRASG